MRAIVIRKSKTTMVCWISLAIVALLLTMIAALPAFILLIKELSSLSRETKGKSRTRIKAYKLEFFFYPSGQEQLINWVYALRHWNDIHKSSIQQGPVPMAYDFFLISFSSVTLICFLLVLVTRFDRKCLQQIPQPKSLQAAAFRQTRFVEFRQLFNIRINL